MKKQITDALVRSVPVPAEGRIEISDTVRPGLRLRVSSNGRRVWMFEKRVKGGAKRKHTFGTYPELSVKEARAMALEIEIEAMKGVDRIGDAVRIAEEKERAALNAMKVCQALVNFDAMHLSNLRTGAEVRRSLDLALMAHMDQDMATLERKDLQALIDAKAVSGAKVNANRLKAYLSKFAKFSFTRGYTASNIGLGLEKAFKEVPRERVLSVKELRQIWQATYSLSNLTGPLIRLLMLTAQRRNEIAKLQWDEVHFDASCLILEGKRTKNGNGHITHLAPAALEELRLRRELSTCKFVFSSTGRTPVSGFVSIKRALDRLLPEDFAPWTFHDFRTAFATEMAERGAPESIVDRILNHAAVGSAPSAVARVYNRAQFLMERKQILRRWAQVVTGDGALDENVFQLVREA